MTNLECKAMIFDLDGVLVDSRVLVERTWRRWAEEHGLDLDKILRVAHGRRPIDTVQLVAPHLDAGAEAQVLTAAEVNETEGVVEIEGAKDLLRTIPENSWAIATSGTKQMALTRLKHLGLPIPSVLVTAEDVANGKPDPQPYLLAAQRLGCGPGECIVVEDAPAGIKAGRSAGMQVIAVTTTHVPGELSEANLIVGKISDIRVRAGEAQAKKGLLVECKTL